MFWKRPGPVKRRARRTPMGSPPPPARRYIGLVPRLVPTLLLLALPSCGHALEQGEYVIRQTSTSREKGTLVDTCSLLAPDGALPAARLTIVGQQVIFDFDLFGRDQPTRMLGRFRKPVVREPDGFTVDGSVVSETIPINGAQCVVPFGQVHLDAVVETGNESFGGKLTIHDELEPHQDPRCPLACDVRVTYVANHKP